MDALRACRCCLRCAPDWDLTTPYTHLGKTEIYTDMLKECFDLHLRVDGDLGNGGICSACAGRLRDARDFKLQVQRSQAELQASLLNALVIIKVEPQTVDDKGAVSEAEFDVSYHVPIEKADPLCGNEMGEGNMGKDPLVKVEPVDDATDEDRSPSGLWPASTACAEQSSATPHEYTCDTCGEHFTGKSSLVAHVRRHRAQDEAADTYSCGTCSEHSAYEKLAKHTKKHSKKTYSCNVCNEQFTAKVLLAKHKRTHMKQYLCRVCDQTFTMRSVFKQHKRSHKTFSCKVCNTTFTRKTNLYKHQRIHTGEKPYTCQYCDKQFAFKTGYDSHVRVHTGEKPYGCAECNKQFRQKGDLNRHKRVHTGERPYGCEVCNRKFTMKSHLTAHKKIHTGRKPYSCEECHKQFSRTNHLNVHKRTHTGEKPFGCEVCNKQFPRKCDLDRHKETHKGEKPYKCETCEMVFTRKFSLIRHVGKHMASSCEVGADTFGDSSARSDQHTDDSIVQPEVNLEPRGTAR